MALEFTHGPSINTAVYRPGMTLQPGESAQVEFALPDLPPGSRVIGERQGPVVQTGPASYMRSLELLIQVPDGRQLCAVTMLCWEEQDPTFKERLREYVRRILPRWTRRTAGQAQTADR